MLIHQITEENFLEEREKGKIELQKKFDKFDGLLTAANSGIDVRVQLAEAFKDPTIWAYATLVDKNNKRLKLEPYQDKFVNDRNRFVYVTASNQIGKSFAGGAVKGLHHALHVPNASVIIISKSEQQAVMVLDEIRWLLRRSKIEILNERVGEVENRTELQLKGPHNSISVIRCFPPTNTVLGFNATLLICDEINFWEKAGELSPIEYYDQVLEPRTNMTKSWDHPFITMGQVFFISNPNGKKGIGWRTFSSDDRFHNYKYCWLAYPGNSIEEYNEAKKRLPIYRFSSIYAAEYVSADGGFITPEQYEQFAKHNAPLVIQPGSVLYLGGDFSGEDVKSKNRDFNILYGIVQSPNPFNESFPKLKVVYLRTWPAGTKKTEIYEEINRLKNMPEVSIAKFCYDKVGVGDKVKNDLIDNGILNDYQIESLTYSLQNKSEVYVNFQSCFEQGILEGRDINDLREQLLGLEVVQMEGSSHLKIHHKREGLHDDHPDALANACWAARLLRSVPVSLKYDADYSGVIEIDECKHIELKEAPMGELECKKCGELV